MKRFLLRTIILLLLFATINLALFIVIPMDRNAYVCEYNHKIALIDSVSQPRILFIGGSNTAFGINSKAIMDSLHCNVVNFGFHAGLGIRYPVEDAIQYIKPGDIVVMQLEYGNFFDNGEGEPETLPVFMKATNYRKVGLFSAHQWHMALVGVPRENIKGLVRLCRYPFRKSFDTPTNNATFKYVMSGFNKYGDEISHLNYPGLKYKAAYNPENRDIDYGFVHWFGNLLLRYEQFGATVLLLPPACVKSNFINAYTSRIDSALAEIGRQYIVEPSSMTLDDSCAFDTGWHMNKDGVIYNTENIINVLIHNLGEEGDSNFCGRNGVRNHCTL